MQNSIWRSMLAIEFMCRLETRAIELAAAFKHLGKINFSVPIEAATDKPALSVPSLLSSYNPSVSSSRPGDRNGHTSDHPPAQDTETDSPPFGCLAQDKETESLRLALLGRTQNRRPSGLASGAGHRGGQPLRCVLLLLTLQRTAFRCWFRFTLRCSVPVPAPETCCDIKRQQDRLNQRLKKPKQPL